MRSQTHGILRIENQAGKRIDTRDTSKTTVVLDPEVARKINSVLSDNVARSAVFGSRSPLILPDRPVAAKTGTTQDFHDAWTVGFTPSIAVGVWVGNNDNAPMKGGSDGVYAAAPLWHDFMVAATRNTPVEKFTGYTKAVSGKLLVTGTRDNGSVKYYDIASGKKLSEKKALKKDPSQIRVSSESDHSILYYVNKNDPLGPTPPDFTDPMLARWEAAPPDTQNPKN